ncbi:hypothetical protein GQX74_014609, partial [Glossina fuscipes]
MDLLGPSLTHLLDVCNCRIAVKTNLTLVEQMIGRLQFIHSQWCTHRDVKPSFSSINFGLAKRYCNPQSRYRAGKNLTDTACYASFNAHLGIELSRKDDRESLDYVMMYFIRGMLPWQELESDSKQQKYEKVQ